MADATLMNASEACIVLSVQANIISHKLAFFDPKHEVNLCLSSLMHHLYELIVFFVCLNGC